MIKPPAQLPSWAPQQPEVCLETQLWFLAPHSPVHGYVADDDGGGDGDDDDDEAIENFVPASALN